MSKQSKQSIAVALQKGGVGKTTIAVNLAERLAARGERVALVDVDQQGNATEAVGAGDAYHADDHLGDVVAGDLDPHELMRRIDIDVDGELLLLPSNESLADAAAEIDDLPFGVARVKQDVVDVLLEGDIDRVIIDSPPSMGSLSDSALVAADGVVVPLLMSEPSIAGLERMIEQQLEPLWSAGVEVDVLALVPNQLSGDGEERRIISSIEETPALDRHLVGFGRSREFEREDSPGPGIRKRVALKRATRDGVPLAQHEADNDMVERFDALVDVVLEGGVGA